MLVQVFSEFLRSDGRDATRASADDRGRPLAFIDRDGVINTNRKDHVTRWEDFEFIRGSLDGLALLSNAGWDVVVVTNQAVINRGRLSPVDLERLNGQMASAIASHGGRVAAVYACPHRSDEGCRCRKPRPGMLIAAAEQLSASLSRTILVGDHLTDLEAAQRAGCRSILVLSGRHQSSPKDRLPQGCMAVMPDLLSAAKHVVSIGGDHLQDSATYARRLRC